MPRTLPWKEIGVDLSEVGAADVLNEFRSYYTSKSCAMACSVCTDAGYKMRYQRLSCASDTCKMSCEPPDKCPWQGKVLICLVPGRKWIYKLGEHYDDHRSPKRKKLTPCQKAFCRQLAEERIRPQRIRNAMSRKFATPLTMLPSLQRVQNFVNYYGRTKLENHDRVKEVKEWIHARVFDGTEDENQPFAFSWENDDSGNPIVGNGGDATPFFIGLSTKALIRKLTEPPENYVFHLDATFKMNTRDFPVLVFGISDRARSFHLIALFVVSQRLEWIYEGALRAVQSLYACITDKELLLRNVMGDAEAGQYNAICKVFGDNPGMQFLMCFFHVLLNVNKHMQGFPGYAKASLMQDIYELHFASGQAEALMIRDAILKKWKCYPLLTEFVTYMESQWLFGAFSLWQTYATASGFATTNNPVEQFNRVLKRDYTLNRRLKMGMLLRELSSCCENKSSKEKRFHYEPESQQSLIRRTTELTRENLLHLGIEPEYYVDPANGCIRSAVMHVVSIQAPRIKLPELGKSQEALEVSSQMGVNYARMEFQSMSWDGWPVDIQNKKCPCKYSFKFGTCIHLVYILRMVDSLDNEGNRVFVNRRYAGKRRRDQRTETLGGRPPSIGPALSFI